MNDQELEEYLKNFDEISKGICKTKRSATEFLIKAGILDNNGEPSTRYYDKDDMHNPHPHFNEYDIIID